MDPSVDHLVYNRLEKSSLLNQSFKIRIELPQKIGIATIVGHEDKTKLEMVGQQPLIINESQARILRYCKRQSKEVRR